VSDAAAYEPSRPGAPTGGSCLVSLHRSEGTGLRLAQAMAYGVPTIVTGHSFSSEMQNDRDSMQIPFTLCPIPRDEYRCEDGGYWAEPDIDGAAKAMRAVLEQPKLVMAKARRAQERAQRQFSPARSILTMRERLAAIDRLRHGGVVPRTRSEHRSVVAVRR
jgi:glycosyltransferase involved in cell wall biosynthesis